MLFTTYAAAHAVTIISPLRGFCGPYLNFALMDLFDNFGDVFIGNNNSKFNKNVVLFFLRENTNLNTKEIRVYLKKYKTLYVETLRKINNE